MAQLDEWDKSISAASAPAAAAGGSLDVKFPPSSSISPPSASAPDAASTSTTAAAAPLTTTTSATTHAATTAAGKDGKSEDKRATVIADAKSFAAIAQAKVNSFAGWTNEKGQSKVEVQALLDSFLNAQAGSDYYIRQYAAVVAVFVRLGLHGTCAVVDRDYTATMFVHTVLKSANLSLSMLDECAQSAAEKRTQVTLQRRARAAADEPTTTTTDAPHRKTRRSNSRNKHRSASYTSGAHSYSAPDVRRSDSSAASSSGAAFRGRGTYRGGSSFRGTSRGGPKRGASRGSGTPSA
jgi:hypothetical protein